LESLVVPFLKALILVPVTLLPIINPLSAAPLFVATVGANRSIAKRLARQVAINGWFVVVV
jgi:multiple antibiotic resistance protein